MFNLTNYRNRLIVLICLSVICRAQSVFGQPTDTLGTKAGLLSKPGNSSSPTPDRKETSVHFYSAITRWNKQIFIMKDLIETPTALSNLLDGSSGADYNKYGVLSDKPTFEILIDLPESSKNNTRMSVGLGYERFHFTQEGFLDVEKIEQGWFSNQYIGESIAMTHDLKSVYVFGSTTLEDYNKRRFWGFAIRAVGSFIYTNLREYEDVTMQTGLMLNNTTGNYQYIKENFSRTTYADLWSMEAGLRVEWHASAHFSIILPQIAYRWTLYREDIPSVTYTSKLDGDQLVLPVRNNGLNSLFFLFGVGLHF